MECIFCKIANKEIPARFLFEDANFISFRDVQPQATDHAVVIPRAHSSDLLQASDTVLQGLLGAAKQTAESLGLTQSGFRIVINTKADAGQSVFHLHAHVLGGEPLSNGFGR